jgi:hypothetical protein
MWFLHLPASEWLSVREEAALQECKHFQESKGKMLDIGTTFSGKVVPTEIECDVGSPGNNCRCEEEERKPLEQVEIQCQPLSKLRKVLGSGLPDRE